MSPDPPVAVPTSPPRRGSGLRLLVALGGPVVGCGVLFLLLLAGTKIDDYFSSRDSLADRPGTPVPSPVVDEPPERGEELYVFGGVDGIAKALGIRVVRSAGVDKPVTTSCDTEELVPSFTCQVTYDGEVVTYAVTVEPDPAGGWRPWEAVPDSLVVTEDGVLAAVWRKFSEHTTDLRCEDGIPERARVEPDTILPQRCYFKPTADHPAYRNERFRKTVEVTLQITDGEIVAAG